MDKDSNDASQYSTSCSELAFLLARRRHAGDAEDKISEAVQSRATELDLSVAWWESNETGLSDPPESLGQLTQLRTLFLDRNHLTELPESLLHLRSLESISLGLNPLEPELIAAGRAGVDAVKRCLLAKAKDTGDAP